MFKEALVRSVKLLGQLKREGYLAEFALIGGMAVSAYTEPRATADIDYVIKLGSDALQEIGRRVKGKARQGDIYDPLAGSVSFGVRVKKVTLPVQLIQFHPAIESIAVDSISSLSIAGISVPIVSRRALVLMKLYAGGPIDMDDAQKLFTVLPFAKDDLEYMRVKAQALRISARLQKITRLKD